MSQIKEFGQHVLQAAAGNNAREAGIGVIGIVIGFLGTYLGGWDQGLQVLLILMCADYVTGLLGAIKSRSVNSDVMFWGGIRKIVVLFVIGLAVQLDAWLGNTAPVFRTAAIYFYGGREGLSVVENLGTLGVPLPVPIRNFLEQLNEKGGGKT